MLFRRSTNASSTAVVRRERDAELGQMRQRRRLRLVIVAAILLIGGFTFWFVSDSWITADGVIVGDLAKVTPLSDEVRIKKLNVKCLDPVSRGQVIAEFENEATAEAAEQQLHELNISKQQAEGEAVIADQEAEAAQRYHDAQTAVHDQYVTVFKAQQELNKKNYVADLVFQQARSDVMRSDAEMQASAYAVTTKRDEAERARLVAKLTDERIANFKASPALMGRYQVTAPKAGYLTQCNAIEGTVVNSNTVLYQVFNPADIYAVVFTDPGDAPRLGVGDTLDVRIEGLSDAVHGTVTGFYPELSGLPDSLTRYFWQKEKWQQYEPVRVDLTIPGDQQQLRSVIRSSAHVQISLWRTSRQGPFAVVGRLFGISNG